MHSILHLHIFISEFNAMDSNITDLDISNSTNYNDTEKDPCPEENQRLIGDPLVQAIFCLLYLIIFCTGVFGNVLVAIVVICKKHMQNVTNLFILNLAMSDIGKYTYTYIIFCNIKNNYFGQLIYYGGF